MDPVGTTDPCRNEQQVRETKRRSIAAAMFYGLPFYQVKTPVGVDGCFHPIVEADEDGNERARLVVCHVTA